MRRGIIVGPSLMAATFIAISSMSASGAHWCGFSARPHAIIQCGYSSREICQSAIGKDAKCFVDPYVVLNDRRTILARVVTHHLQQEFGQPVVVENRSGASGKIGIAAVARAVPDGYTILSAR